VDFALKLKSKGFYRELYEVSILVLVDFALKHFATATPETLVK